MKLLGSKCIKLYYFQVNCPRWSCLYQQLPPGMKILKAMQFASWLKDFAFLHRQLYECRFLAP